MSDDRQTKKDREVPTEAEQAERARKEAERYYQYAQQQAALLEQLAQRRRQQAEAALDPATPFEPYPFDADNREQLAVALRNQALRYECEASRERGWANYRYPQQAALHRERGEERTR